MSRSWKETLRLRLLRFINQGSDDTEREELQEMSLWKAKDSYTQKLDIEFIG